MSARMIFNLSDGNVVLFGGGSDAGRPDIDPSNGLTRASAEEFQRAFGTIGVLVKTLQASIDALPNRPEKIEIEFAATFSRECDLWIVSNGAPSEFRIRLGWEKEG
jgi:hypothetical protein